MKIHHSSFKLRLLFFICLTTSLIADAQIIDSASMKNAGKKIPEWFKPISKERLYFPYRSLVIPSFMIAYGFTTLSSDGLKDLNEGIQDGALGDEPHKKIHIDNYLQFAPAAAVYALNLAGIKGKNNFRDKSILYLISNVFLNVSVNVIKKSSHVQRPDASSYTSFPSGHTAEAFASAEFLRQEYKDVSPWYGVAGYAVATATGLLRIYNNKHWMSDVVAGAGVGIASTKFAYWLYPKIRRAFFRHKSMNTMVMPYYQNHAIGLSMSHQFR